MNGKSSDEDRANLFLTQAFGVVHRLKHECEKEEEEVEATALGK